MNSAPTRRTFLERPGPLGTTVALLILMGFFFVLPSAFRAARLSLKNKENDVKDWLPSDFPETAELDWFADHFAGESFVLATWPGCNVDDQRLRLLEEKLLHESASFREELLSEGETAKDGLTIAERRTRVRARELGEQLNLLLPGQPLDDWGGLEEKWLASSDGTWFYITPAGRLYRWEGSSNGLAGLWRATKRGLGSYELEGQLVTAFGKPSTPDRINPFYNDPSLICAPLFETVETGATIVEELASKGGALWPIDLTDESRRAIVAKRRALERLTGTLFAPAVPPNFDWSAGAFAKHMTDQQRGQLPEGFDVVVAETLESYVKEYAVGEHARSPTDHEQIVTWLGDATTSVRTNAWYAVFDRFELEPPPRLTCLLVTLTDLAKDNLAYAVGRGTLGSPQGRLLALAEQSGIRPPSPPSTAPPPFNRDPPDALGGLPPLRMGGPPIDNIAIDEEGTVTLVRLIGYCILIGVVLSYLCFRSLKITVMLFVVGGSSAMLAMAMVGWSHGRVDAILLSMPSLVYVLGLSGSIHVINYYRDEVRFRGQRGAATRALAHAALPCTLAALTTAIGLASLFTSNLKPISNFGLYAAIGVISTLGILFSYLPAALEVFAPSFGKTSKAESETAEKDAALKSLELELARWWAGVGRWITGHHRIVSVGCLLFLCMASLGLFRITTTVQLLKLFDSEARILRDYGWLEENFGNLVPMEIVVRMPREIQRESPAEVGSQTDSTAHPGQTVAASDELKTNDDPVALSLLERIEAVSRIRTVVTRALGEEGTKIVGQASSMDTFLPPLPPESQTHSITRYLTNSRISDSKSQLLESDYVKIEKHGPTVGSELWRLSLRVSALSDVDYGLFINDLRDTVSPVIAAYRVRAALIRSLQESEKALNGKQKVLIVGSQNVASLDRADFVRDDASVDQVAIFLSTLKELLQNEPIKGPMWIDPTDPEAKFKPGGPNWDKLIAEVDAVIWVQDLEASLSGQGSVLRGPASHASEWLAGAKRVIRADEIAADPINKRIVDLTPEASPDSTDAGLASKVKGENAGHSLTGLTRVPVFDAREAATPQVVFTGVVPVVYKAQRTLLGSLVESIVLAFVLIGIVMIVLLNPGSFPFAWLQPRNLLAGFLAGSVSMIPNVFPVLLVFGLMGHGSLAIDIGTMMTASVAMGVAVDDTIHFLTWFRQFLEEGKSRVEAVIETYRRVGPAMTQTTIVGGLGLFVFALSTFTPTQRFGTLMLVMLAAALIGDLILLPALLAGPLGKCFQPRSGAKGKTGGHNAEVAGLESGRNGEAGEMLSGEGVVHDESIPVLKVHMPPSRTDAPHRQK